MSNARRIKNTYAPTTDDFALFGNPQLDKEIVLMESTRATEGTKLTKYGRRRLAALRKTRQERIDDGFWDQHFGHCTCRDCRMMKRGIDAMNNWSGLITVQGDFRK